jgi:hypothetical protein
MKKLLLSMMAAALFTTAFAQESNFGISTDIVSRYVFRGTQFSASPVIQPGMAYSTGGLTLGAWGSYAFDNNAVAEADLYASYAFDFGLSLVATDYFFPADPAASTGGYFDTDNHWFELGASYSISKLTLSAYYMLNQENDMYFEAGYAFNDNLSFTLGGGDKMYSYTSDDLNVCNIGLKYKKEVAITETFKVSPYASFIVNPNQEQVFLVVGVTL